MISGGPTANLARRGHGDAASLLPYLLSVSYKRNDTLLFAASRSPLAHSSAVHAVFFVPFQFDVADENGVAGANARLPQGFFHPQSL